MRVFGIRNGAQENPIFGDYVVDSVSLLNKRFNPQGRYFYFDEGDIAQQIIGGHKVFDMYGWVVDEADVAEFEQLWLANADRKGSPDGSSPMDRFRHVTVTWEDHGGKPYALVKCIIDYETSRSRCCSCPEVPVSTISEDNRQPIKRSPDELEALRHRRKDLRAA